MTNLERTGILVGLAVPLLAAAWWAGSGYVEVSDRLAALETATLELTAARDAARDKAQSFAREYERAQAENVLINQQVHKLAEEVEWLKFHHHHDNGEGRAHVD